MEGFECATFRLKCPHAEGSTTAGRTKKLRTVVYRTCEFKSFKLQIHETESTNIQTLKTVSYIYLIGQDF